MVGEKRGDVVVTDVHGLAPGESPSRGGAAAELHRRGRANEERAASPRPRIRTQLRRIKEAYRAGISAEDAREAGGVGRIVNQRALAVGTVKGTRAGDGPGDRVRARPPHVVGAGIEELAGSCAGDQGAGERHQATDLDQVRIIRADQGRNRTREGDRITDPDDRTRAQAIRTSGNIESPGRGERRLRTRRQYQRAASRPDDIGVAGHGDGIGERTEGAIGSDQQGAVGDRGRTGETIRGVGEP